MSLHDTGKGGFHRVDIQISFGHKGKWNVVGGLRGHAFCHPQSHLGITQGRAGRVQRRYWRCILSGCQECDDLGLAVTDLGTKRPGQKRARAGAVQGAACNTDPNPALIQPGQKPFDPRLPCGGGGPNPIVHVSPASVDNGG